MPKFTRLRSEIVRGLVTKVLSGGLLGAVAVELYSIRPPGTQRRFGAQKGI